MGLEVWVQHERGQLHFMEVHADLFDEILRGQLTCPWIAQFRGFIADGRAGDFRVREDGMLMFRDRMVVPSINGLRERIMREAHATPYSIHPGSNKMYQDLRRSFWWHPMKKSIVEFVSRCQTCQQVKIEHQRLGGLVGSLPIPAWKWEQLSMDFVTGLRSSRGYDGIWVIVDRLTMSTHFVPIRMTWSVTQLADLFIQQIIRLHGVLISIVSDRDDKFTSHF